MIDFIVISGSILRLGCLDCDSYIGDIVILWIVKPGFCSIHYTVTFVRLKNVNGYIRRISLYRRSLYRGSTVPYRSKKEGNCFPYPPRKQPTTITTTKSTETQLAIRLSHRSALPTCSRLFIYQFIYLFIYLFIYCCLFVFLTSYLPRQPQALCTLGEVRLLPAVQTIHGRLLPEELPQMLNCVYVDCWKPYFTVLKGDPIGLYRVWSFKRTMSAFFCDTLKRRKPHLCQWKPKNISSLLLEVAIPATGYTTVKFRK